MAIVVRWDFWRLGCKTVVGTIEPRLCTTSFPSFFFFIPILIFCAIKKLYNNNNNNNFLTAQVNFFSNQIINPPALLTKYGRNKATNLALFVKQVSENAEKEEKKSNFHCSDTRQAERNVSRCKVDSFGGKRKWLKEKGVRVQIRAANTASRSKAIFTGV